MLSKKVKERIKRNKLRRLMRYPARVRVAETDLSISRSSRDYQRKLVSGLPLGGYPRNQLVVFAAQGRVSRPLDASKIDSFIQWTGERPLADQHIGRPAELKKFMDDQMTLRQVAKAEFLSKKDST